MGGHGLELHKKVQKEEGKCIKRGHERAGGHQIEIAKRVTHKELH